MVRLECCLRWAFPANSLENANLSLSSHYSEIRTWKSDRCPISDSEPKFHDFRPKSRSDRTNRARNAPPENQRTIRKPAKETASGTGLMDVSRILADISDSISAKNAFTSEESPSAYNSTVPSGRFRTVPATLWPREIFSQVQRNPTP